MNIQEAFTLSRTLKGAPIHCLFLMAMIRQPMNIKDLSEGTGYHRNTVSNAINLLCRLGFAVLGEKEKWQLTNQGYQLPLPNLTIDAENFSMEDELILVDAEKFSTEDESLSVNAEKFSIGDESPSVNAEKFSIGDESPSVNAEKFSMEDESQVINSDDLYAEKFSIEPENDPETAEFSGPEAESDDFYAENFSMEPEKNTHVLKHVVVLDSDSDSTDLKQQQHEHGCVVKDLITEMIEAFIAEGVEPEPAATAAKKYLRIFGMQRCRNHLPNFHLHCEAARNSPDGLKSPVGLFVSSVRGNWQPSKPLPPKPKTWYTDEELEHLIQH